MSCKEVRELKTGNEENLSFFLNVILKNHTDIFAGGQSGHKNWIIV